MKNKVETKIKEIASKVKIGDKSLDIIIGNALNKKIETSTKPKK